jgi:uncharacterized membrane protein
MPRRHFSIGAALVLALFFGVSIPGRALGDDDAVEEVEEVEVLAESPALKSASAQDGGTGYTVLQIIGRNHPAAVHIPIGMLIAVCLIELLSVVRPGLDLGKSEVILSAATALGFVLAAVTGLLRASEVFANREIAPLLIEHRNVMIAAFAIFLLSLAPRFAKKDRLHGAARYVYLALLFASLLLTGVGGHYGGQLVYGESYLPY